MATLKEILNSSQPSLAEISEHLNRLSEEERISQVVAINKAEQIKLWELAVKGKPLTLEYLVPSGAKPLEPFPFEGKNSLPIYTRFQKVFYKASDGTICGYNNSPASWIAGPGYYVAEMSWKNPKEIAVNYMKIPKEKPQGWPEIKSNMSGFSRFIYDNTVDFLRWVSDDVVIGRAYRRGEKEMSNWFVLCRRITRK